MNEKAQAWYIFTKIKLIGHTHGAKTYGNAYYVWISEMPFKREHAIVYWQPNPNPS
jgi:hypothetical protein